MVSINGTFMSFLLLLALIIPGVNHLPVSMSQARPHADEKGRVVPSSAHLHYCLDSTHLLVPVLLGEGMLCFLLKPSGPRFTFPPSASPQEPGSSPEPMAEVRSEDSQAGWCKAVGHSLPLPFLYTSQPSFTAQALPEPP